FSFIALKTLKTALRYSTVNRITNNDKTKHYNLEMIIAIGYRVRSHRGTQFRQWATERLNEYLVKDFTMDDDRLKKMRNFGQDYFDELLERIRDIRASEKRLYQKITDISNQIPINSNHYIFFFIPLMLSYILIIKPLMKKDDQNGKWQKRY